MIGGFLGLAVFFFLAGVLIDEEGSNLDTAQGIFWLILIVAAFASFLV